MLCIEIAQVFHYDPQLSISERSDVEERSGCAGLQIGQVCIMVHSGSRGLGHQVATDALTAMEKAMARDNVQTNDRQLACARISSPEGQVTPPQAAQC